MKKALKTLVMLFLCLGLGFGLFSSEASADVQIDKVLTTTSQTPVALMDISMINAATSTSGCYIGAYGWYDLSGNYLQGQFGTETCRVEIRVDAYDGFYFSPDVAAYLNNESATVTVDETGKSVYITRDYAPAVWQPTVIKHPGSETVTAGEWASFVATATYTSGYSWHFVSPEGKYYSVAAICEKFPGLSTSEDGYDKLNVYGIPLEMDGWKLICRFSGPGGSVDSQGAKLTVKPDPATVTPSPEPTPEATPEPSAEPEADDKENEEEHEHDFSGEWHSDADYHWQQCTCGEEGEKEGHKLLWVTVKKAGRKEAGLEEGTCGVCGYVAQRETQPTGGKGNGGGSSLLKTVLVIFGGVVLLLTFVMIIISIVENRRRKRRRRRRR